MSLIQYCLLINNHVGKAAGRMFTPPPCETLLTSMVWAEARLEAVEDSSVVSIHEAAVQQTAQEVLTLQRDLRLGNMTERP